VQLSPGAAGSYAVNTPRVTVMYFPTRF
jgi:hypothetical protein